MLTYSRLTALLSPLQFDIHYQQILDECLTHNENIKQRKAHKIRTLVQEKERSLPQNKPPEQTRKFFPRLINNSEVNLRGNGPS